MMGLHQIYIGLHIYAFVFTQPQGHQQWRFRLVLGGGGTFGIAVSNLRKDDEFGLRTEFFAVSQILPHPLCTSAFSVQSHGHVGKQSRIAKIFAIE